MPTRFKKTRKFRGSRTHGWGQSAGHRGSGSQGGYGKAGGHKHKWTYTVSYEPDRYGKHGFTRQSTRMTTINVGTLSQLVDELLTNGQAVKKDGGIFIDLEALQIDKVLGAGRVDKPLILRVQAASSTAARKIREAKGQLVTIE